MVIVATVLLGILLVTALSKGINDGLPTYKQQVCYWPVDLIYALPRLAAPFLIIYPMIIMKHVWCLGVGILLYLIAWAIKGIFWRMVYGINIFRF